MVHPIGAMIALTANDFDDRDDQFDRRPNEGRRRGPPDRGDDRFDREDFDREDFDPVGIMIAKTLTTNSMTLIGGQMRAVVVNDRFDREDFDREDFDREDFDREDFDRL